MEKRNVWGVGGGGMPVWCEVCVNARKGKANQTGHEAQLGLACVVLMLGVWVLVLGLQTTGPARSF